ncbi:MASE4 domain-containing protein [Dechloromonas sp. XY25]|uniref:histidine kinase n=1 Tax=Dechloromonas hankyongensis TaxID=2908002 RepID=A0ABS9K125_9RHOO|nr:MASE4 domain-containing protein [Dechloromonas hankyongensis]MCG2576858.1 MASE4 domain-containing protein [Dechloromonas hankyongensis]
MAYESSDDSPVFLSTLAAGRNQRRFALAAVLVSAALFLCAVPFAKVPLVPVPAFIPIYESALVINDLITAVFLFGQFGILRSRALFVLACGYLFTAFLTIPHALTFPGLFSATGLLGAGPQTTAWLYTLWHGGFPLYVITYTLLKGKTHATVPSRDFPLSTILSGVAAVLIAVCGITALTTAGHDLLPALMLGNHYTVVGSIVFTMTWVLSIIALAILWRRKPYSVLDVWLMVVLCVWIFDIALSAVLNGGRFDLGFYAGRIYGLLAASSILLVLLLENLVLYIRLAEAHDRARHEAVELERLRVQSDRRAEERTAALEALNHKDEEIRAIVENQVDCVITIDTRGIVRSTNPALERVLGFAAAEVIGHNVSMLMPEPHRSIHDSYLANYLGTGEAQVMGIGREVEGRHKDGRLIPLELAVSQYVVRGERFFVGTLRDIRERKRFIAELTRARADAEQANRAKSDFLAAMSHEIRTPMNGVVGMIDVLHQTSLKGYQVEMADLIRDSAFSLLTIIDDILDFSKIEAGKLEIERAPLAVADVVEKVAGLLDRLAEKKGVELTLFTDPSIPPEILGDALRLRQVLVNLANNAIKFSSGGERSGSVAMRAVLAERDAEKVVIEFQVTDNGIGMDDETMARLFAPFNQADVSTTRRFGGTGLGLAISRHLVELMGGTITVRSTVGTGATFTASIPFATLAAEADTGQAGSAVAGVRCLVVGAASGLAADFAAYLAHGGATVEQAPDLPAAADRAASLAPGLWVCVIVGDDQRPSADALHSIGGTRSDLMLRFVVVGRGTRRRPRAEASGVVQVDRNVLTRRMLLKAVAIAAGRAEEDDVIPQSGKISAPISPPSREEAGRSGRLVLVAEDNETNQKVILQQLHLLGFAADIVGNGHEVLERLPEENYAALLTDLHMPKMDGYQLTTAIRAQEQGTRHLPIIALTANALKEEATHCRSVGMDDYLSKPVQLADLQAMLKKWLPAAETGPGPAVPQHAAGKHVTPVDIDVLKTLVGSDPKLIRELLQLFQTTAAQTAVELKRACASGMAAKVSAEAHKLKSSARSVGAFALGELCAQLEASANSGRNEQLSVLLPRFEEEMAHVETYLQVCFAHSPT